MLTVHSYERIRHAYVVEGKIIRQIGREYGHGYWTVRKALEQSEPQPYQLSQAKDAPVLGAYKEQIEAMVVENERLPRKQRYTSRKIYRALREAGYQGAESTVRAYVSRRRKAVQRPALYLPLVFDPGIDAQVDWGEATVILEAEASHKAAIQDTLTYFRNNHHRMLYDRYRKDGLQIGSGTIESGCKHVIAARLKQAGMIWSPDGARFVAKLRTRLKSRRWDETLALRPAPHRSYDRKAA